MAADSLNFMISYTTNNIMVAILISSTIMGFNSLSNGGYFIYEKLPLVWKIYHHFNFNTYTYSSLMSVSLNKIFIQIDLSNYTDINVPDKYRGTYESLDSS